MKRGGVIILVAQCSDGIGKQDLYELLKAAGSPQAMIDRFHHIGFTSSSRKAYMFARAMLQATVFVVTDGISASTLKDMMLMHASCVADALQWSLRRLGHGATVLVIPHADLLIPNVK